MRTSGPSGSAQSSNKSEATPRLPHGYRVHRVLRRRAHDCHRSRLPGTNASSAALLAGPGARGTSTHKAWYALRCEGVTPPGRFGCGTLVPRWQDAQLASFRGSRTPSRKALPITTYQVVAIEGVEPSTGESLRLLYPAELHCSGGTGLRFCAVHTSSSAAARQCGWEPQPLRPTIDQDLGDDEHSSAHRNSFLKDAAGGRISAGLVHIDACTREPFGTPRSRNSIWSARILRLLRMKASYRFGTYGT